MESTIENENVVGVYTRIAKHFSDTRVHQWPWITEFINNISSSSDKNDEKSVLDIGCGNGRNLEGFTNCNVYGIDNCMEFVKICHERNKKNVIHADMTNIPFPDKYFDFIMSIASFHHLATEERRIKALREFYRISTPNCKLLLSVWSIRQPPNTKQAKNITHYGDTIVKWNKFGESYERYYYIFEIKEILNLFQISGWCVENHFWDYGNEIFVLTRFRV